MSYKAYFSFTAGLSRTLTLPKGSINHIHQVIDNTETTLCIKRVKYLDNPEHWDRINYAAVEKKVLCETALRHNTEVIRFYDLMAKYSENPVPKGDKLTPKVFKGLLAGLQEIHVPSQFWTGDYYTSKMETLYEVMRGNETDGISFDAPKLTTQQAAKVIILFSEFLDHHDRRLDVPKGHDYLASSYNGGYEWCENCGAITWDDSRNCNKRKCAMRKEHKRENSED